MLGWKQMNSYVWLSFKAAESIVAILFPGASCKPTARRSKSRLLLTISAKSSNETWLIHAKLNNNVELNFKTTTK